LSISLRGERRFNDRAFFFFLNSFMYIVCFAEYS
jgi:hypothetical protein